MCVQFVFKVLINISVLILDSAIFLYLHINTNYSFDLLGFSTQAVISLETLQCTSLSSFLILFFFLSLHAVSLWLWLPTCCWNEAVEKGIPALSLTLKSLLLIVSILSMMFVLNFFFQVKEVSYICSFLWVSIMNISHLIK